MIGMSDQEPSLDEHRDQHLTVNHRHAVNSDAAGCTASNRSASATVVEMLVRRFLKNTVAHAFR